MKSYYTYKGYKIFRTETTTTVKRRCPPGAKNRYYYSVERVFEIEGLHRAGCLPIITSLKDAKAYINEQLDWNYVLNHD